MVAAVALLPETAVAVGVGPNPSNDGVVLKSYKVEHGTKRSEHGSKGRRSGPVNDCPNVIFHHQGLFCETITLPGPAPAGAVFSPGMAQSAVENLPMPSLALNVQPDGPTLVNADTIFYAEPETFTAEIELLDHTIEVRAEPVSFIWVHGDGSEQSTSTPGKPYPSRDVTHRYLRPSGGVSARVDTVYEVEFSIDGDGWEELEAPLVAVGPSTSIEVQEAAPVLVRE